MRIVMLKIHQQVVNNNWKKKQDNIQDCLCSSSVSFKIPTLKTLQFLFSKFYSSFCWIIQEKLLNLTLVLVYQRKCIDQLVILHNWEIEARTKCPIGPVECYEYDLATWEITDLASVVDDGEVGNAAEVRLHELGVFVVCGDELLHEGLVGGFGEPALFVQQRHDSHRLHTLHNINKHSRTSYTHSYNVVRTIYEYNISTMYGVQSVVVG